MISPEFLLIHHAMLLVLRRILWIRTLTTFPLPPLESLVFTLLARNPSLKAGDLARELKQQKSKVSRILTSLERKQYLSSSIAEGDRRTRELSFTPKGKALLTELDQSNNQMACRMWESLDAGEFEEIRLALTALADGLGASPVTARIDEHPLFVQQRRLGAVTGMSGKVYMSSGHDILGFQVLFELYRSEEPLRFLELVRVLPFEPTRLSRQLAAYVQQGMLETLAVSDDKRGVAYSLTPQGRRKFEEMDLRIAGQYEAALRNYTISSPVRLAALLHNVHSAPFPEILDSTIRVKACSSAADYRRARAFLVEELVRQQKHHSLSSELLPESNLCLLALRGEQIVCCCEIRRQQERAMLLEPLFNVSIILPDDYPRCLREICQFFFRRFPHDELELPASLAEAAGFEGKRNQAKGSVTITKSL